MTPLKNTDKHFSDYLPPALVKDWRQCFRSRNSLLLFILLELAGWLLFVCLKGEEGSLYGLESLGGWLYFFGLAGLCFVIPYRAGSTVAADTRVRSSNFLMLTPLSARRIVWGTWCSTALMVLIAAICALPLLATRQVMMSLEPDTAIINLERFNHNAFLQDVLVLAWLTLCGWVMAACYMFSAGLSRLLQLGLPVACAIGALFFMGGTYSLTRFFCMGPEDALPHGLTLSLHVVDALLLMALFLELARRHYAAPAENCSRSVRLLALLPMLLYVLLPFMVLGGGEVTPRVAEGQGELALLFLYAALLADALLPTCAMPAHALHLWRGLPAWFQKPGLVSSSLCLALASLLYALPGMLEGAWWESPALRQALLFEGVGTLNFGFSLLLWLLVTDCLCRRNSPKRPVVFALVALGCSFIALCLRLPLEGIPAWVATLPLAGEGIPWELRGADRLDEVITAAALNGGALYVTLMLLIFWRGRAGKG